MRRRVALAVVVVWACVAGVGVPGARAAAGYVPAVGSVVFASGTQLWVFWQGSGGSISDAVESIPAGTWSGPSTVPGTAGLVQSAPSATVSLDDGEIDLFWQGRDDGIWESSYTATGGWSAAPSELSGTAGTASSGPGAMNWQNGSADVVFWAGAGGAIDADNVYPASQTTSGVSTIPSTMPAGSTISSAPAAAPYGTNQYNVFWLGADGGIWNADYVASSNSWVTQAGEITSPGASTSAPTTADTEQGDAINVAFRAPDGSIDIIYTSTTTDAWDAPQQVEGTSGVGAASAPVLASDDADGGLDLLWEVASGQIERSVYSPSSGWLAGPLADVPMSAPPPVTGTVAVTPPVKVRRGHVRATVISGWNWRHPPYTSVTSLRFRRLPRHATIELSCSGRGCPRRRWPATGELRRLEHRLLGIRFRAGDRLTVTIHAPHLVSERLLIVIHDRRPPTGRSLG